MGGSSRIKVGISLLVVTYLILLIIIGAYSIHLSELKNLVGFKSHIITLLIFCGIVTIASGLIALRFLSTSCKVFKEELSKVKAKVLEGSFDVDLSEEVPKDVLEVLNEVKEIVNYFRDRCFKVQSIAESLLVSVSELSSVSHQFKTNLSTQAEKTNIIASSAEEMSVTIADIAKNTSTIFEASKTTADISKKGQDMTVKTSEEIKGIEELSSTLAEIMGILEERAKAIEGVLVLIRDIAEQTNLLALNATIEAARAGEHGKSFAVVAGEIRKLAEKTNQSTDEIGGMIKQIQSAVSETKRAVDEINERVKSGVNLSIETTQILKDITTKAEELEERIHQVATATEEMAKVSEQMSQDINTIAQASNEMTQGLERVISSVEKMSKETAKLKEILGFLKSEGGEGTECPNIKGCPFFKDVLPHMPDTADILKREYCLGHGKHYTQCARFMVAKALGREFVPKDLFPNQHERAKQIIATHSKST